MNQLKVNQQQSILVLHEQGWSKRRIARELALDRGTVRKYLAGAEPKPATHPHTGPDPRAGSKSPGNPHTGSGIEPAAKPPTSPNPHTGSTRALGEAQTVQALLQSPRLQAGCRDGVLVVDEYSLLSVKQLHQLLTVARRQNARVLFSGDARQHLSVEAGDTARIVERETPVRVTELRTIRRQAPAKYRAAVQSLADGEMAKGLKQLEAIGAIIEVTDREARHARMVDEYLSACGENKEVATRHGKRAVPKDCLMIAPTRAEIDDLTALVRERLKREGQLEKRGVKYTVLKNADWTLAERKDCRNFQGGEVVVFHGKTASFAKGEQARVLRTRSGKLEVQRASGRTMLLTSKQAGSFSVFTEKKLELCSGDKLRLQTPCLDERGRKLANGLVVTLESVTAEGKLKLADGRTIATQQLTHGYAMTSHGAQGVTCDRVFVAGAMSKQGLYVSASRGRESATFYTPDKAWFLESAGLRSEERQSALEFAREAEALTQSLTAPAERLNKLREKMTPGLTGTRGFAALFLNQTKNLQRNCLKTCTRNFRGVGASSCPA